MSGSPAILAGFDWHRAYTLALGAYETREAVDQVGLAVVQRMKRNVMQQPVLHEDQMLRVEPMPDGRDQLLVEILQMRLRSRPAAVD